MPSPKVLTAKKTVGRFKAGKLPSPVLVRDTAAHVAASLDGLEAVAVAGKLTSIVVTDAPAVLSVKAAQVAGDAAALAEIAGGYQLIVRDTSGHVTASLAALEGAATAGTLQRIVLVDPGTPLALSAARASLYADALARIAPGGQVVVSDNAVQIAVGLDGLQTIAHAGNLTSIQITGGSTQLTILAAQVRTDAQALARIAGPYALTVKDTEADVAASLNSLEAGVRAGTLTRIILTDPGKPALTITYTQFKADADVLALLPANYTLFVTGVSAANATAVAAMAHVSGISVTDTAAHVVAHLAEVEALVGPPPNRESTTGDASSARSADTGQGQLGSITLTDPGTPLLTLSDGQLLNDGGVLGVITSPYALAVTGVLAADVASLAANPLVQSLSVSDTAANVSANLSGLEAANTAGKIATISTSGVVTSSDTSAAAMSLYARISGASGITLNVGQSESFIIPDNADITAPLNFVFPPGYGFSTIDEVFAIQTAMDKGYISSISAPYTGFAYCTTIDLLAINNINIANAFFGSHNELPGFYVNNFSVTQAEDYYSSPISTAIETGSLQIAYAGSSTYVGGSDATMIAAISDNAANLQNGLDALTVALAGRSLTVPIQLTDPLPPTLVVSAAQAVNDAAVLNAVTSSYLLSVQGTAAQLNALDLSALTNEKIELTFTSLDRDVTLNGVGVHDVNLAGLAVTGGATVGAYASGGQSGTEIDLTGTDGLAHKIILLGADPAALGLYDPLDSGTTLGAHGAPVIGGLTVAQALTASGPVAVTDTVANIAASLDALQAAAARITGIGFSDAASPTLTITEAQVTADASVLALLSGGYALAVTSASTADATTLAAHTDVASVALTDSTANILASLDQLERIDKAGKLAGITLTDPGTSLGAISGVQLFNDADVVRLIEAAEPPGPKILPPTIASPVATSNPGAVANPNPLSTGLFVDHMAAHASGPGDAVASTTVHEHWCLVRLTSAPPHPLA